MNLLIVTPAPPRSRSGNRVTALRWSRIFRHLGHRVRIREALDDPRSGFKRLCRRPVDALIALHARKSVSSITTFRAGYPDHPIVLALTGTDIYGQLRESVEVQSSLERATRLVVLQSKALEQLSDAQRSKAHVIYQSVSKAHPEVKRRDDCFEVCVIGHLREVKDPFRTAEAVRLLPRESRISVIHVGAALDEQMALRAQKESESNPRYEWVGALPHAQARRLLARSRLMVLSSKMEGGANVVSEAIVAGVPVISSRIDGSLGLLGDDYAGYFPVGDTAALARLLNRAETDTGFHQRLCDDCEQRRPLFEPSRERESWRLLLDE